MNFVGGFILGFIIGSIVTIIFSIKYLPKIITWYLKRKTKNIIRDMNSLFSQLNKEDKNGFKESEQEKGKA